jgi:mRNA (guanine-N7-)-methyltransferase
METSEYRLLMGFVIFDVVFWAGEDIGKKENLLQRMNVIESTILRNTYNINNNTKTSGIHLILKHFLPISECDKLSHIVTTRSIQYDGLPQTCAVDGIVFTPSSQCSYYGTMVHKWKPVDAITVDFRVMFNPHHYRHHNSNNKPYLTLYLDQIETGELILDSNTITKLEIAHSIVNNNNIIVECRFQPISSAWILVGVRTDKIKSNSITTAWKALESVSERLEFQDVVNILTTSTTNTIHQIQQHYDERQQKRNAKMELDSSIAGLRRLNNAIKSKIIELAITIQNGNDGTFLVQDGPTNMNHLPSMPEIFNHQNNNNKKKSPVQNNNNNSNNNHNNISVLDLACGRGGDIGKWFRYRLHQFIGLDISKENIEEAQRRYNDMKQPNKPKNVLFIQGDAGMKNLLQSSSSSTITIKQPFDFVSVMFALHYFCNSELAAQVFFENMKRLCKNRILITVLDVDVVQHCILKNNNKWTNGICNIQCVQQDIQDWYQFGNEIIFSLGDAVQELAEPLVPFPVFSSIATSYGFKCICRENFSSLIDRICTLDESFVKDLVGKVAQDRPLSVQEWQVAQLYTVWIFEKN